MKGETTGEASARQADRNANRKPVYSDDDDDNSEVILDARGLSRAFQTPLMWERKNGAPLRRFPILHLNLN